MKGADQWVIIVLRVGYSIPFKEKLPLSSTPVKLTAYFIGSEVFSPLERSVVASGEESNRSGGMYRVQGILQQASCSTQSQGRMETSTQHECTELIHNNNKVSHGNTSVRPIIHSLRGLDDRS